MKVVDNFEACDPGLLRYKLWMMTTLENNLGWLLSRYST